MWRLLRYILFLVVFCMVSLGVSETFIVSASFTPQEGPATNNWISDPIALLAESPTPPVSDDSKTCGGRVQSIQISGEDGWKEACVFGTTSSVRLARYRGVADDFSYALAYPTDTLYSYIQGLCPGLTRCVYGYSSNTLVLQTALGDDRYIYSLIGNFTDFVRRQSTHYVFEYDGPYHHIATEERTLPSGIVSVSANGRWAFVEVTGFGFIRVDLKTLEHKRIVAYNLLPTSTNQALESTISDDGRWATIVGYASGALLYEIDESCGDQLTDGAIEHFSPGRTPCNSDLIRITTIFPGYLSAHMPRFSSDGKRLLLGIQTQAQFVTATFMPGTTNSVHPYYLAFGDSFSSGEGELSDTFYINSTNSATNQCHVSSRSYPYLLGSFRQISTSNLACSGSRIAGVQLAHRKFIAESNSPTPSVVTLGIGGNDVDFIGKLKTCISVGTCEWAKQDNKKATAHEIKALFPKLVEVITDLKTNFSPSSLVLVGYPNVINDQRAASCSPVVSVMLDSNERRYMSESIKYLNVVIKAAAAYTKVSYADIEDAYQGERLCDQNELAMNSIRYGDDIAPISVAPNFKVIGAESFHPTPRGHQLAAQKINSQLDSSWASAKCTHCQFNDSQLAFTGYWLENTDNSELLFQQLAYTFLKTDSLVNVSNVAFSFLSNIFAPNSRIKFEFHSEVQPLGDFNASDDGSLQGELELPDNIEGYHTVHAYGESRSGKKLDMYQTVYVNTMKESDNNAISEVSDSLPSGTSAVQSFAAAHLASSVPWYVDSINDNLVATQPLGVVQNITESKSMQGRGNVPKIPSSLASSFVWWSIFCLSTTGALLLLTTWLFYKRKDKSLPRYNE